MISVFFLIYYRLHKPDPGKVMEEKESADEPSWKQQHEDTATTEEKVSLPK